MFAQTIDYVIKELEKFNHKHLELKNEIHLAQSAYHHCRHPHLCQY